MGASPHPGAGVPGIDGQGANKHLAVGDLAQRQLQANSVEERNEIRANATSLSTGEWELFDDSVMEPLRDNLVLTQMFEQAGLTQDIEWWQTETTWSMRGGMTEAEHSTTLKANSEEDIVDVGKEGVAIPYSIKDYRINRGELERSRRTGMPLDTTFASEASRKVAELVESTILYGAPDLQIRDMNNNVFQTPGLLNVSGRFQQPASGDWGTGTNSVDDTKDAVHTLKTNKYPAGGTGYWMLHSQDISREINNDYATQYERSHREKIEQIPEIGNMVEVPTMPTGNAVIFKPSQEVIDIARLPDGPLNMQWTSQGGQEIHNKIYHLLAPRIKHRMDADNGNLTTGIVHISGA